MRGTLLAPISTALTTYSIPNPLLLRQFA